MEIITIDGVDLPHPSTLNIDMVDIDSPDTARNELGVLFRYRVRAGLYKVTLGFNVKKSTDIQTIVSAISPPELQVTFPTQAGMVTKKMYVSDRKIEVALYSENIDEIRWNMTFSLVEY